MKPAQRAMVAIMTLTLLAVVERAIPQEATNKPNSQLKAKVSGEFTPNIGQGTNSVTARKIKTTKIAGIELESIVVYDKNTKCLVASNPYGKTLVVKGRYLSFLGGVQQILIVEARPKRVDAFTESEAAMYAENNLPMGGEIVKRIDVTAIAHPDERYSSFAPIMTDVDANFSYNELTITFKISNTKTGKLILDDNLQVITIEKLERKGQPK